MDYIVPYESIRIVEMKHVMNFFFFFFFNDTATTEIYTLSLHDALPTWYLLGRWRGSRALELLTRLVPRARTHVQCASHLRLAHGGVFQLGARFLPALNPIAAGLAGAAGMSVSRFLPGAAVSAAVWAGIWIGIGYLLTHGVAGLGWSFGIPLTFASSSPR